MMSPLSPVHSARFGQGLAGASTRRMPPSATIRFGADESTDRASIEKIRSVLASLKTGSVGLLQKVEPAFWAGEIGYHCDFAETYRIHIGDQEFFLDKTGHKNRPDTDNYSLRRAQDGWELNLYDTFTTYKPRGEQAYMATISPNQRGWRGEKGTHLIPEKTALLAELRAFFLNLEKQVKEGPAGNGPTKPVIRPGVYKYQEATQRPQMFAFVDQLKQQGATHRVSGHTANGYGFVAVGKHHVNRYEQLADFGYQAGLLQRGLTEATDNSPYHPYNVWRQMQQTPYRLPREVRKAYTDFQNAWQSALTQLDTLTRISRDAMAQFITQGKPIG